MTAQPGTRLGRRLRPVAAFLILALVSASLVACSRSDTTLYISNDSGQAWYLSVPWDPKSPDVPYVVRVPTGVTERIAVSWFGGPDVPVSVLRPDCSRVGTLTEQGDGSLAIAAIPGLTGRIEDHGRSAGRDGLELTDACGGLLLH